MDTAAMTMLRMPGPTIMRPTIMVMTTVANTITQPSRSVFGDHAGHDHSLMSRDILTMLGSVFLVTAHVRNLSKCREGCQLEGCDQHV